MKINATDLILYVITDKEDSEKNTKRKKSSCCCP